MLTTEANPRQFLDWLSNRLKFKYKEDEFVLHEIQSIINNHQFLPKKISIDLIDKICKKHYPDFDIDKTPDLNIGYTDNERMQIKQLVVSIIEDITKIDK